MQIYPRFLAKNLIDEYIRSLSPEKVLFSRYRELKNKIGNQNQAFELAGYEREFDLSESGIADLKRMVEISSTRDVYLICQCERDEHCHVDLMLLTAESKFGAKISKPNYDYPVFCARP